MALSFKIWVWTFLYFLSPAFHVIPRNGVQGSVHPDPSSHAMKGTTSWLPPVRCCTHQTPRNCPESLAHCNGDGLKQAIDAGLATCSAGCFTDMSWKAQARLCLHYKLRLDHTFELMCERGERKPEPRFYSTDINSNDRFKILPAASDILVHYGMAQLYIHIFTHMSLTITPSHWKLLVQMLYLSNPPYTTTLHKKNLPTEYYILNTYVCVYNHMRVYTYIYVHITIRDSTVHKYTCTYVSYHNTVKFGALGTMLLRQLTIL